MDEAAEDLKSGFKGVSLHQGGYIAQICVNGKRMN